MSEGDRQKWDAAYRDRLPDWARDPAAFLVSQGPLLPRAGRALDVAGGAGRNALWLARRGLDVTLVDVSPVALEHARAAAATAAVPLRAVELDLDDQPLPAGPWDVIVDVYFMWRPLFTLAPTLLAPGGLLVFAHATRRNLERHERPGPSHVFEEGEVARLVGGSGLEVLSLEEGWFAEGRHEARLVARRPAGSEGPRPTGRGSDEQ